MQGIVRKKASDGTMKRKVTRSGTVGSYEVTGWRYLEDLSWHVRVWLAGRPGDWIGYTVTGGVFELKIFAQPQKEAILRMIAEWEGESSALGLNIEGSCAG
jgi:hypothetical protein